MALHGARRQGAQLHRLAGEDPHRRAFTKARILSIDEAEHPRRPRQPAASWSSPGFQGVDDDGNITTLGRGGSDTTGVALAAALKADECQIYTDVDGVYTTDPRIVPEARRLRRVTFEEMLELASLGSKVLQIRSVEFAGKYKVRLRVLSSFPIRRCRCDEADRARSSRSRKTRTWNRQSSPASRSTATRRRSRCSACPTGPGIAYAILGPIADANIDVDMIVQNVGHDGLTDFSFTVHRNDYAQRAGDPRRPGAAAHQGRETSRGDERIAKVSIVGIGMRSHAGIAAQMFRALADEGINIQMISTSEIKISVVIDEKYTELAVRVLHKAFELDQE